MGMSGSAGNEELVVAFHLHSNHVGYEPVRAAHAFELVRGLGGNGARFEMSWFDLEPEQGLWDSRKIAWYSDLVRLMVDSFGLEPIVNLAGAPPWAAKLLRQDRRAFIHHWRVFCDRAVDIMGGRVRFVQVWNEPNNPVLQIAERAHAHVGIFYHGFFHDMLYVAAGVMRPSIQPLEILINVTTDLPNWERFVTACIHQAADTFDIIGLDFYRSSYLPLGWSEFRDLERLFERVNAPQDSWFGKQAALVEFGFSTFLPPLRNEAKQLEWANIMLPEIRRQNQVWQTRQAKSLRLISWYQLYDEPRNLAFPFLAHFGIVRLPDHSGNGQKKLAFDTVRRHLCALRQEAAQLEIRRDPECQKI